MDPSTREVVVWRVLGVSSSIHPALTWVNSAVVSVSGRSGSVFFMVTVA